MSLKHTLLSLGSLSAATATIAADGPIGVGLVCGLIALAFSLVAVLALTGTFGRETHREDAQTVLAILLGREQSRGAASTGRKPQVRTSQAGAGRGPQSGSAA
jgi:hypothetical protein